MMLQVYGRGLRLAQRDRRCGASNLWCKFKETRQSRAVRTNFAPGRGATEDLGFAAAVEFARKLRRVNIRATERLFPRGHNSRAGSIENGSIRTRNGGCEFGNLGGCAGTWTRFHGGQRLPMPRTLLINSREKLVWNSLLRNCDRGRKC